MLSQNKSGQPVTWDSNSHFAILPTFAPPRPQAWPNWLLLQQAFRIGLILCSEKCRSTIQVVLHWSTLPVERFLDLNLIIVKTTLKKIGKGCFPNFCSLLLPSDLIWEWSWGLYGTSENPGMVSVSGSFPSLILPPAWLSTACRHHR